MKHATHSDFRVALTQEKLGLSITFRVSRYQSSEILGGEVGPEYHLQVFHVTIVVKF